MQDQQQKQTGRHDSPQSCVQLPNLDINKVNIKSKIDLTDVKGTVKAIVPLKNKTAWVATHTDRQMLLINCTGSTLDQSVTLGDSEICDAKKYINGLLVTCIYQSQLIKMASDGKTTSTFADLKPYFSGGICVTSDMNVMVCLHMPKAEKTMNKIVKLGKAGNIIQTIKNSSSGAALYKDPYRVTSLSTGEIILTDWTSPRRIVCVDGTGQHVFTWEGQIMGKKKDRYSVHCITSDNNNNVFVTDYLNHRMYKMRKGDEEAICLFDKEMGVIFPWGIAVDDSDQLWVGCDNGKVYIFDAPITS